MKKPSLLYASPFAPMKSGISDYSEALVKALQDEYDITLLTGDYNIASESLKNNCSILRYERDEIDFDAYDYKIYNIGNNPEYHDYIYEVCMKYPGMIILHDMVLYYLFVGYYQKRGMLYSKTYKEEGVQIFRQLKNAIKENGPNLLEQKFLAEKFILNSEILRSANKIMVHSYYSYNKILQTGLVKEKDIAKINHIALLSEKDALVPKDELFKKYNIPMNTYIISSMGYISETKLNHAVCEAVRKMRQETEKLPVCYVMVGEGDYADKYVDGKTIIKTGYTELDEFNSFIEYSDVILNLRNPSMGETSGAMLRILQKGKVCVINDGGWFSEIPDDCVLKVSLNNLVNDLAEMLQSVLFDSKRAQLISKRARKYIQDEHSGEKIVKQITEFISRT